MINCTETSNDRLELTSDNNNKTAEVRAYDGYWSMIHHNNGQRKNFNEYHEILEHLTAKGW